MWCDLREVTAASSSSTAAAVAAAASPPLTRPVLVTITVVLDGGPSAIVRRVRLSGHGGDSVRGGSGIVRDDGTCFGGYGAGPLFCMATTMHMIARRVELYVTAESQAWQQPSVHRSVTGGSSVTPATATPGPVWRASRAGLLVEEDREGGYGSPGVTGASIHGPHTRSYRTLGVSVTCGFAMGGAGVLEGLQAGPAVLNLAEMLERHSFLTDLPSVAAAQR